jgi:hypothetical protein
MPTITTSFLDCHQSARTGSTIATHRTGWIFCAELDPHTLDLRRASRYSVRLRRPPSDALASASVAEREDEEKRTAGYIVVLVNKQTLQLRALPGPIFHKSIYPDHDSTCKEIIFLTSFIFSIKMLFNCIK